MRGSHGKGRGEEEHGADDDPLHDRASVLRRHFVARDSRAWRCRPPNPRPADVTTHSSMGEASGRSQGSRCSRAAARRAEPRSGICGRLGQRHCLILAVGIEHDNLIGPMQAFNTGLDVFGFVEGEDNGR